MMGNLAFLEKKAIETGGGLEPFSGTVAVPLAQRAATTALCSPQPPACWSLAMPGRARHCCIVERRASVKGYFCREQKLTEWQNLMQHVLRLACLQTPKINFCSFLPGMWCLNFCSFTFPKQGVNFQISTPPTGRAGRHSVFSLHAKETRTSLHVLIWKGLSHLHS